MPRLVLCHGVFDLLHPGHVEHLREARELGDTLLVSVVPDAFLTKRRPIHNEENRLAMLRALRYVDHAVLCGGPGPEMVIQTFRPQVYVRGNDYIGKEMPESKLLKELGIEIVCTKSDYPRTTELIERIANLHNEANRAKHMI